MRRFLLEIAVEVPDRGIGVPIGAVVEFDALAQVEDPFGPVRLVLFPALGQAGTDVGELVGARQIPRHKAFEHRKAEKAQALAAIVRDPVVVGTSDAVIATRKVPPAQAEPASARTAAVASPSVVVCLRSTAVLLLHVDRGEVLKPALRTGEPLDVLRHCPRVAVVHDEQPDGLVD